MTLRTALITCGKRRKDLIKKHEPSLIFYIYVARISERGSGDIPNLCFSNNSNPQQFKLLYQYHIIIVEIGNWLQIHRYFGQVCQTIASLISTETDDVVLRRH